MIALDNFKNVPKSTDKAQPLGERFIIEQEHHDVLAVI